MDPISLVGPIIALTKVTAQAAIGLKGLKSLKKQVVRCGPDPRLRCRRVQWSPPRAGPAAAIPP
jgi:hypothetical protein